MFHEFSTYACYMSECARARVLYMGGGVENTGVVRSIRTSRGSIGTCTTRARYTFVEVNHLKIVTIHKRYINSNILIPEFKIKF